MTTTRALTLTVCVVIGAGTMAAALQEPQPPAVGGPQQGRGQGADGRQGGRGPNFAQQQRPLADPAVIDRGRALYGVNCTACHGVDLRGGDQGGPNLLRSAVVLTDQKGENFLAVVRSGQQGPTGTMPAFQLPDGDVVAIAEYVHSVLARAGRQGRPPEADSPFELNAFPARSSTAARRTGRRRRRRAVRVCALRAVEAIPRRNGRRLVKSSSSLPNVREDDTGYESTREWRKRMLAAYLGVEYRTVSSGDGRGQIFFPMAGPPLKQRLASV